MDEATFLTTLIRAPYTVIPTAAASAADIRAR